MAGSMVSVPNKPKTPLRAVRISDETWTAARAKAEEQGDNLSEIIRAALERYVKAK